MTLTLSPAKVGTWALHEILTSAQANKIASELVKAVDGVGGGSYSLTVADLTFTGSRKAIFDLAVQLTAGKTLSLDGEIEASATGRVNLRAGSGINVFDGAAINLDGAGAGGHISMEAGSSIDGVAGAQLTGEFDVPSGSILKFARAQDIALAAETFTRRSFMVPAFAPAGWEAQGGGGGANALVWVQNDVSAPFRLLFPLRCLPGDIITAIAVELQPNPGHGALPTVFPRLTLASKSGGGAFTTTLAATNDSAGSVGIYEAEHALVLNSGTVTTGAMPVTVGTDPVYLSVLGEANPNAVAGLQINSITIIGTRTKIANSHDFD